jgi:hypothetical protein
MAIRFVSVGFVLALASASQAMPLAPLQNAGSLIVNVREDCGAGFTRVNGKCVLTPVRPELLPPLSPCGPPFARNHSCKI